MQNNSKLTPKPFLKFKNALFVLKITKKMAGIFYINQINPKAVANCAQNWY